ncbi:DUF805 domain-containing protein [Halobacteriovorax sp. HLS]|uniref:DUF805 domain-containing protein n=1 Tax=Halobacteriovorax sp. HLS TaxID=2234000 RepID=UPI000FDB7154|nr:DUF805 domain-containing protein [Halobacteriovorax sp. HLS]
MKYIQEETKIEVETTETSLKTSTSYFEKAGILNRKEFFIFLLKAYLSTVLLIAILHLTTSHDKGLAFLSTLPLMLYFFAFVVIIYMNAIKRIRDIRKSCKNEYVIICVLVITFLIPGSLIAIQILGCIIPSDFFKKSNVINKDN